MAGDWIKMRVDLPNDPAVYRLSAITNLDRFAVVGRLYGFWSWIDKHAVDGRVTGASPSVVDDITQHQGFAAALIAVKWLIVGEDFVSLPNHERHNGESAKERGLKNARQARWRGTRSETIKAPSNTVDGSSSTPPSTVASTREEKRREEKSIIHTEGTGAPLEKPVEQKTKREIPTLEQWTAAARELHPNWPAAAVKNAWDYYESVGWKSGKNPIVKWRGSIGGCYSRWYDRHKGFRLNEAPAINPKFDQLLGRDQP